MSYESTTTLRRIKDAEACVEGYAKLLKYLGKTKADDEPLDLLTVLNSNGLDDALWVLSYAMPDDRLARHFQAWCARQVLHLFEAERPDDRRVRDQIEMLENDAARAAARAAAWDAARGTTVPSWTAARAATVRSWAAARAAALDAQEAKLRVMLGETQ